jgi:hypothetical protein
MTYEELQQKIADIESLIDVRYAGAVKAYHQYVEECLEAKKVFVKPEPLRSQFEHHAMKSIDRLKKEFAMQNSPADVGDVIKTEKYIMRVERVEAAAFEYPTLQFYGTYLKQNGEPYAHQITRPILQTDITKIVKLNPNK